jgi:hypothetical protein
VNKCLNLLFIVDDTLEEEIHEDIIIDKVQDDSRLIDPVSGFKVQERIKVKNSFDVSLPYP